LLVLSPAGDDAPAYNDFGLARGPEEGVEEVMVFDRPRRKEDAESGSIWGRRRAAVAEAAAADEEE
jgi:hypothetical protein